MRLRYYSSDHGAAVRACPHAVATHENCDSLCQDQPWHPQMNSGERHAQAEYFGRTDGCIQRCGRRTPVEYDAVKRCGGTAGGRVRNTGHSRNAGNPRRSEHAWVARYTGNPRCARSPRHSRYSWHAGNAWYSRKSGHARVTRNTRLPGNARNAGHSRNTRHTGKSFGSRHAEGGSDHSCDSGQICLNAASA